MEITQEQSKKANISLPSEIIQEILSRLPIKSVLRFTTVYKPWLSHISDPSFKKLHFTRATTSLFISAYDNSTHKQHFLSAALEGGHVTHLMTLDDTCSHSNDITEAEHLNGLVCFSSMKSSFRYNYHFILNPSTRKIFKLPVPDSDLDSLKNFTHIRYLFGFDESRNEHKILNVRKLYARSNELNKVEIMIFSMSSYSWRKIDVELPLGFSWHVLGYGTRGSICLNSVVHLIPRGPFDILAFDLRTEKFSVISTPQEVVPHRSSSRCNMNGKILVKNNTPRIINIDGVIGVVCHDRVMESNEMHIWILQDYENNVWVREIITFPKPWIELNFPFPLDVVNKDEIIFSSSMLSGNVISVLVYDRKRRCFKSLQFTLGHQFLNSKSVKFNQVKGYVESMVHL